MPRESSSRVRFILFCDQVRQESNSKNIYIGTYGNAMLVEGSFPAVLASFAVAVSIDPPVEDHGGQDEDVLITLEVPGVDPPQTLTHKIRRKHPMDSASLHLNFVPFVIPNPGEVKVSVALAQGDVATAKLLIVERDKYNEMRH